MLNYLKNNNFRILYRKIRPALRNNYKIRDYFFILKKIKKYLRKLNDFQRSRFNKKIVIKLFTKSLFYQFKRITRYIKSKKTYIKNAGI